MSNSTNSNKKNICYYFLLFIVGVWFFFLLGENGYILEKDSYVYLENNSWIRSYGYIIYPLIIQCCKLMFAEYYLEAIYLFQGLFALLSSVAVSEFVRKNYGLSRKLGLLVFVLSFGPYTYSLPQFVSIHGIMTEGISFPLFNFWMICALQLLRNSRRRWYVLLFTITVMMTFTRPQLLLFFIVDIVIILDKYFQLCVLSRLSDSRLKLITKTIVALLITLVGCFVFALFVKKAYFPQLTDAVSGRVLCTTNEEDEELYSGEMKQLFIILYDEVDKKQGREKYFRHDVKRWEDICNAANENTKLLGPLIVENLDVFSCPPEEISSNKVKSELIYPLLIKHWDRYLLMTVELFVQSLVVSIFIHPDWAYIPGYCVALVLFVLSIFLMQRMKEKEYSLPMRTVVIVILLLCGLTNVIFIGLQRYVVYPFGWFYISLVVMFNRIYETRKEAASLSPQNESVLQMNCVFCFDEKVFEPACVAIASLLDSKKTNEHFDIYCIVDKGSIDRKSELEAIVFCRDNNSRIHVMEAPDCFEGAYEVRGISRATYTRLLVHRILPQIDKILYSDVDVLFRGSLKELWETDIKDVYFAAVKGTNNFKNKWEKYQEYDYYNEICSLKGQYVNAGILLMNLAYIRESGIENEWLERAKKQYEYQDQDILNIACKNKIIHLPLKYNLAAYLIPKWFKKYYVQNIYCKAEAKKAYRNPIVLHYAGEKPWNNRDVFRGDEWWRYVISQDDISKLFVELKPNFYLRMVDYIKHLFTR